MCTPFSRATGFSFASASSDVSRRPSSRDVMRRAGGLSVLADVGRVDRDDLALEPALGPRPLRAHLRLEAELVGVGAGDAPLVGDALGAFELRRELVVLAVRRGGRSPEVAAGRRAERDAAHRLDAARQRDVDHARLHERGREVGRLLRRAALASTVLPRPRAAGPALSHALRRC